MFESHAAMAAMHLNLRRALWRECGMAGKDVPREGWSRHVLLTAAIHGRRKSPIVAIASSVSDPAAL